MNDLTNLSQTLGGLPPIALVAVVILSGFALAGFAIYAVLTATKARR